MTAVDFAIADLGARVADLERAGVRFRQGEITATSPLSVALGGDTVAYTGVHQLASAGQLAVGDVVAVLAFNRQLLILDRIGAVERLAAKQDAELTNTTSGTPFAQSTLSAPQLTILADGTYLVRATGIFKSSDAGANSMYHQFGVNGSAAGMSDRPTYVAAGTQYQPVAIEDILTLDAGDVLAIRYGCSAASKNHVSQNWVLSAERIA